MSKIQIKKTITLNLEKRGTNLIVGDLNTLALIYGSASVSGNERVYKYSKEQGMFVVPIEVIKNRIKVLKHRQEKLANKLEIMEQIISTK